MTDNILSDIEIVEIDKQLNYEQIPLIYINRLIRKYPNSYYIRLLQVYFEPVEKNIINYSKKLDKVNNTFALLGSSIQYKYVDKPLKYLSLIEESLQQDKNKINRWVNLEYYNILLDRNYAQADSFFEVINNLYPDFLFLNLSKAEFLRTDDKIQEAINLLEQYEHKFNTNNPELKCKLGECYLSIQNFDLAKHLFKETLKTSENAYAYNGLSWVYFFMGNYDTARNFTQKSLNIIPNESEFCWRMAILSNILNEKKTSYIFFQKAIEFCSEVNQKEEFIISYIDCLLINGEYKNAEKVFNSYKNEYNTIYYFEKYKIALAYFLNDNFNDANSRYNEFIKNNPDLKEQMTYDLYSIGVDFRQK